MNLSKYFPDLSNTLSGRKLSSITMHSGRVIVFYKTIGDICKFYQPDIIKRNGYIRLSGSIGFALTNTTLNGGIDFPAYLDPVAGVSISMRLENFASLMETGTFDDGTDRSTDAFVDQLSEIMESQIPNDLVVIKRAALDTSNWIGNVILSVVANPSPVVGRNLKFLLN